MIRGFFSYYILVAIASILPIIFLGIYTYTNEKNSNEERTLTMLESINQGKKEDVEDYYYHIAVQMKELRNNLGFFKEQSAKSMRNLQDLQKSNIKIYYQSLEKILLFLAQDKQLNTDPTHHALETLASKYQLKGLLLLDTDGKILYAQDAKYENMQVQRLSSSFSQAWKTRTKNNRFLGEESIVIVDFGLDKKSATYKQYMLSSLANGTGYLAFEVDQKPIEKILKNLLAFGESAESYLVYKNANRTYLASNRYRKSGHIGDAKDSLQIQKGFTQSGVELKYGSTGDVELVAYSPFVYKNLHRTLQSTVKFLDVISPKVGHKDYLLKFVQDYHFCNLLLFTSKKQIIYNAKQEAVEAKSLLHSLAIATEQKNHLLITPLITTQGCDENTTQFVSELVFQAQDGVAIVAIVQLRVSQLQKLLQKDTTHYFKSLENFITQTIPHDSTKLIVSSAIDYDTLHWKLVTTIDKAELEAMSSSLKREVIGIIVVFSIVAAFVMFLISYYKTKQDKKLIYSATHDSLTGLPNRRYIFSFLEYILSNAKRKKIRGAVLFMDLDKFKFINDSYGHEAGDLVLVEVAKRLQSILRQNDILARLGGDEFLVIVNSYNHIQEINAIAQRIIDTISKPIVDKKREYFIGVSIGIAVFPSDSMDAKELLQFADTAMYKTKEKGRNGYTYYSKEMTEYSLNAARVESELKNAIKNDELRLYYQPQIDIKTKKIVGVEALVRWQHPVDGLVMPNDFIPIAEESQLIVELGKWVTRKACQDFKSWKTSGYKIEYVAVNMSAKQLACNECSSNIQAMLEALEFPAEWLELEITENTLIQNFERVSKNIEMFKSLGIRFSIDDFGTGYSSLSYLKSLQISTLKIDREFIKDILVDSDDYSIVKAVINMGHSLNYKIIAEGTESAEVIELLDALGCDVAQGYYYAKPLKELELLEFMEKYEDGVKDVK